MATSVIPERNLFVADIVKFAARGVLSPFFKVNVMGAENIPEKGAFVLLPRHQRWEDIPLIAVSVKRYLYYIAKQELFDNLISKRLIAMMGGIPLDRLRPSRNRDAFTMLLRKLSSGDGVVLFPEGTYFKNRVGEGHPGLIRYIYENIDTLFIPAGIEYRKGKYRANVSIAIGKAMKGSDFEGSQLLFVTIMDQIARLSGFKKS